MQRQYTAGRPRRAAAGHHAKAARGTAARRRRAVARRGCAPPVAAREAERRAVPSSWSLLVWTSMLLAGCPGAQKRVARKLRASARPHTQARALCDSDLQSAAGGGEPDFVA